MSVVRHSGVDHPNDGVADVTDEFREADNLDFFLAAFQRLATQDTGKKRGGVGNKGRMTIGLVGERDLIGVTLRQAQSVVRFDHRPSKWSHAFLVIEAAPKTKDELANLKLLEVTMSPRGGAVADPNSNGLTFGKLGNYTSPVVTANAALLAIQMTEKEADLVEFKARRPNRDRIRYNLWDSLCVWQSYYWSQGHQPNPLAEGFPLFSSSYVEYAFEAIDLDITPAASERNSAPEHLWNSARYWHENLDDLGHPIYGYSVVRDPGCSVLYQDEVADAADVVARAFEESEGS